MDVDTAVGHLVAMLDVSEKRYPPLTAELHVNEACHDLSEDTDVWFDRYLFDYNYSVPTVTPTNPNLLGAVPVAGLTYNNMEVGFFRNVFWQNDDETFKPLDMWNYREMILTHQEQPGTPENVAILGQNLLIRPVPEVASVVRFEIKGKCAIIGGEDTNGWLTHAPFAVLYKAAINACIYLMEDSRIPVFQAMYQKQMDSAALHGSMMVHSEPRQAQEPG